MHVAARTVRRIDYDSTQLACNMSTSKAAARGIDTTPFELLEHGHRFTPVGRPCECDYGCTSPRARDMRTGRLIIPLLFDVGDKAAAVKVPRGTLPSIDFSDSGISLDTFMRGRDAEIIPRMLDPDGAPFEKYFGRPEFEGMTRIKVRATVGPSHCYFISGLTYLPHSQWPDHLHTEEKRGRSKEVDIRAMADIKLQVAAGDSLTSITTLELAKAVALAIDGAMMVSMTLSTLVLHTHTDASSALVPSHATWCKAERRPGTSIDAGG